MENSSKALIIISTVLIIMLLIGAGMYVFNNAGHMSGTMKSSLSQEEALAFNQRFLKYNGEQSGVRVKELIVAVNKANKETAIEVSIDGFVYGSSSEQYYPKSTLINSKYYKVEFSYDKGVINKVKISAK